MSTNPLNPLSVPFTPSASFERDRALNRGVLKGAGVNKFDGRSTRRRIEREMRRAAKKAGSK